MDHTPVSSVQDFGPRLAWPKEVVYVGMPGNASRAFGIPDTEGLFGKPWNLVGDPRGWPAAYVEYLTSRMAREAGFADAVGSLHGLTLLCWCTRKQRARGVEVQCHARILAEFVELLAHAGER